MGKRIRAPPHYIAGLGDGNVKVRGDQTSARNPEEMSREEVLRIKKRDFDNANNNNPNNANNNNNNSKDPWDVYFQDPKQRVDSSYRGPVQAADPWQFSAFALLACVVLMSALFLHLISDTKENKSFQRRRPRPRPAIRIDKKTDLWNDDEEEDHLGRGSKTPKSEKKVEIAKVPSIYYHPYQPRLQQRVPQRKAPTTPNLPSTGGPNGAASASGTGSRSTTQPTTPVSVNYQQQLLGEAFNTGSYYMHPSGGALYRSPASILRSSGAIPLSSSPKPSPKLLGLHGDQSPMLQHQQRTSSVINEEGGSYQPNQPPPFPSQRAVVLASRVESFSSITGNSCETPTTVDEETGTPRPRLSRPQVGTPISNFILSPGTEDVDEFHRRISQRSYRRLSISESSDDYHSRTSFMDATPRVANGRQILSNPNDPDNLDVGLNDGLQPPSDSSFAFAAPPKQKQNSKNHSQQSPDSGSGGGGNDIFDIPFVPSLSVRPRMRPPPMSVNLDALNLHQMESGNVSHWEARIAEESQILQQRVFSGPSREVEDAFMFVSGSVSSRIPSDDPRASIEHKRTNLTQDTNSARSLQSAIEFSKLELIEVIGGGGFGQVWKAKWRGTPVAVKVLIGSAQAKNVPKAVLEEFAAEINLLKGMQHPNICLYMGACVDPPNRAIVTELAANGSLWDALRLPLSEPFLSCDGKTCSVWPLSLYQPDARHGAPPGPSSSAGRFQQPVPPRYTWPWVLVKKVGIGVARGMAYLHGGDPPVLHRDLKSANILLDESYNPKVCDFGLSRLKAQERSMTGNCGTVQWMAPEVLANQSYNEKADIFSYGIICWELLTRQCPYDGMTAIQCALAVLNRDYRPEIPKWCPPPFHALIRSCVKKNPEERPTFEDIIKIFDAMPDF